MGETNLAVLAMVAFCEVFPRCKLFDRVVLPCEELRSRDFRRAYVVVLDGVGLVVVQVGSRVLWAFPVLGCSDAAFRVVCAAAGFSGGLRFSAPVADLPEVAGVRPSCVWRVVHFVDFVEILGGNCASISRERNSDS